jgi:hypothetical protein
MEDGQNKDNKNLDRLLDDSIRFCSVASSTQLQLCQDRRERISA